MNRLKKVLMERDELTEEEASEEIARAREEFHKLMSRGVKPFDFMKTRFGLEPDYLMDLIG